MTRKARPKITDIGRPQITLDWDMIDGLLESKCSANDIAGVFGCHADTIRQRCITEKGLNFSDYAAQKHVRGDSLLRKKQYDLAISGNITMLIWLGKHRLGQHDRVELTTTEPEVRTMLRHWEEAQGRRREYTTERVEEFAAKRAEEKELRRALEANRIEILREQKRQRLEAAKYEQVEQ